MVALLVGCAGAHGSDRGKTAQIGDSRAYNVMPLRIEGVRDSALASREAGRLEGEPGDTSSLQKRLERAFDDRLAQHVRVRGDAPLTIVPTLTLAGPAGSEGLAAETTDAILELKLLDHDNKVLDEVTFKRAAEAPLAREESRDQRLEKAMEKLADKYAARLESR